MPYNHKKTQFIKFDQFLLVALVLVLLGHYAGAFSGSVDFVFLAFFASLATAPVLFSAYRSVVSKKINVDLLAGVALMVALLNQEWASAVFINLMLTSARIFSDYTQDRARTAIKSLLKLRPEKVKVQRDGVILELPVTKINIGDLAIIELGERIPVDGPVLKGEAMVDQASLTGESLPVAKNIGDNVLSSTLVIAGSLVVRAEKVGKDTAFEKIIKLVEQSQKEKAGIQTTADKFTVWYIVATFIAAVSLYLVSRNLNLVLAVLLVTCADDIAVAIPMAFSAAIANAAKRGIIIKGGSYLEGLARMKTLLLDKTGTLTRGMMKVENVLVSADLPADKVLQLAAGAEFFSDHPVARAIVRRAEEKKISIEKSSDFREFSGQGSFSRFGGQEIVCGKKAFLLAQGIALTPENESLIKQSETEGASVLLVGLDKKLIGAITLADEIRPEAKGAIKRLKELGVKEIVMITGDNEKVARKVSSFLKLTGHHANLLPENKLAIVKKYLNKKFKVGMVGDGVNDAASLALADIGIAMGAIGTDAAIEAADVALMKNDFSKVPEAVEIGRAVARTARENFWIWGTVNLVGLALVFAKVIGPEGAAAYNFVTDFFPIANSLRLLNFLRSGSRGQ